MLAPDDPGWISDKVIGAHSGRRHLSKIDLARLAVETKIWLAGSTSLARAIGALPGQSAQNEQSGRDHPRP